jgi:23S rRNA pseudouridine1911/1915/1917 synthase
MPKPPRLEVLYEDNHLLVVNKPVDLATQGVAEGTPSVITHAKDYLKRKFKKPGNVYLGVVSRLDASVSGVLVLARTSKAAARLTKQFQDASTEKVYWTLVERPPIPAEGDLSHWLLKNDRERRVMVVPPRTRGSQHARLSYRTITKRPVGSLVEVQLHTGRKHQIRVQLAAVHCPILGDRKYGSRTPFTGKGIALHCVRLSIEHPTTRERLEFRAPPPDNWGVANYIDE